MAGCPLLAHSGHRLVRCTCLLLTQSGHAVTAVRCSLSDSAADATYHFRLLHLLPDKKLYAFSANGGCLCRCFSSRREGHSRKYTGSVSEPRYLLNAHVRQHRVDAPISSVLRSFAINFYLLVIIDVTMPSYGNIASGTTHGGDIPCGAPGGGEPSSAGLPHWRRSLSLNSLARAEYSRE